MFWRTPSVARIVYHCRTDGDRFRPEVKRWTSTRSNGRNRGTRAFRTRCSPTPRFIAPNCDRIFLGASWQYLGLADELPEPGDYKTSFLGETPVIVTRGEDGDIHAMVNRCAHRGNLVCLKQRGHTKDGLTCVYHAWRYDLAGNLTSVAFRRGVGGKGGMPESFRLEEHGLKKLRTDQFAGLVFGTLSPEAPPLPDYIGNLIGSRIGRVMRGKPKILGTTSQILHNNWKLYIENVKDTYHASLLHTFFTTFRITPADLGGRRRDRRIRRRITRAIRRGKPATAPTADQAYAGIHSLHEDYRLRDPRFLDIGRRDRRRRHIADPQRLPEFRLAADPQFDRAAPRIAERAGRDRAAMDLYRVRG